jgi:hypothetical protein
MFCGYPLSGTDFVRATFSRKGRREGGSGAGALLH